MYPRDSSFLIESRLFFLDGSYFVILFGQFQKSSPDFVDQNRPARLILVHMLLAPRLLNGMRWVLFPHRDMYLDGPNANCPKPFRLCAQRSALDDPTPSGTLCRRRNTAWVRQDLRLG